MKKFSLLGTLAIIVIALLPFSSCTNLDEKLYSEIETDNFFRTEEEVKAAVGAAYTNLYGLMNHGSYFSSQEVNSNEMLIPQRGNDWYDGGQWIAAHLHTQIGTEDCFNNSWGFLYGGVNTCNRLILQVSQAVTKGNLNATIADAYVLELRGIRALYYYWLLDTFGNVPVVDKYDVPEDFVPETKNRVDVFNFVEKELTEIYPKLSRVSGGDFYSRFNFYTAQALLSKLYLNAKVYTGTAQDQKALNAADSVITSTKFALMPNYRDNFLTTNEASTEFIFAIPYDKVFAQGFNLPQMTLHYQSQNTFNLQAQPWNGYCAATDFYNSYDDADLRKKNNFLVGQQFKSDGVTKLLDDSFEKPNPDKPNDPIDPDGATLIFTPEINQLFPKCLRQAGVRVGKFEFSNGATPNLSNDFPIFRYADILLVRAEVESRLAGDWNKAVPTVNSLRSRARLAAVSTLDADQFLNERSHEVFYEGWRRQDLIRFGKFNEPHGMRTVSSEAYKTLWPIPTRQKAANPKLAQNPGYPQ
jgi:starch-binding outer membrane protein, SusD/RagB family